MLIFTNYFATLFLTNTYIYTHLTLLVGNSNGARFFFNKLVATSESSWIRCAAKSVTTQVERVTKKSRQMDGTLSCISVQLRISSLPVNFKAHGFFFNAFMIPLNLFLNQTSAL